MRPTLIIIRYPATYQSLCFFQTYGLMEQKAIMLQGAPESLHMYVVCPSSFAIHADEDVSPFQSLYPFPGCILTTLVCVKDFRTPVAFQCHF